MGLPVGGHLPVEEHDQPLRVITPTRLYGEL
jgi:hypothetical protein